VHLSGVHLSRFRLCTKRRAIVRGMENVCTNPGFTVLHVVYADKHSTVEIFVDLDQVCTPQGKCFVLNYGSSLKWADAQSKCAQMFTGGSLASLHSAFDQNIISKYVYFGSVLSESFGVIHVLAVRI
jgi:hypothetical protein